MKQTENYRRPTLEVYDVKLEAGFAQSQTGGGVLNDYSKSSDQFGAEYGGTDDQFE